MTKTNFLQCPDYEEFLQEDEIYQFECDMEEKKYKPWVKKLDSKYTTSIFGAVIHFAGSLMTETDVIYFKKHGVDLNVASNVYPSDLGGSTTLGSACEFRYGALIKALIIHGADVNLADQHDYTPIESLLIGHNASATHDVDTCVLYIKFLSDAGAKNEARQFVINEICQEYSEKSLYLKIFLENISIRDA